MGSRGKSILSYLNLNFLITLRLYIDEPKDKQLELLELRITPGEIEAVLEDFTSKINYWCEYKRHACKIPQRQMCKVAIQVFGKYVSEGKIRYCIDGKFKDALQSQYAKEKKTSPEKKIEKLKNYGKKLGLNVIDSVTSATEPLHQFSVILTRDEN